MSLEEEKQIRFPEKHYVGFQRRKDYVNLGFMTPYGTDSAAKKRIDTVDKWAKGNLRSYDYETKTYTDLEAIPSVIYENAPLDGFLLTNPVNHSSSWNSCRDKWRIEDPRGFELEITSGNLEQIMARCVIDRGVIKGQCIWARLGPQNILVPVDSDIYRNAMNNTKRYETKASIRDVDAGDLVELQNGSTLIYIGLFHLVNYNKYSDWKLTDVTVSDKKYHVFEDLKKEGNFNVIATPKLATITKGVKKISNPEKYVNETVKSITSHVLYRVEGVSLSKIVDVKLVKHYNQTTESFENKSTSYYSSRSGFVVDEEDGSVLLKFSPRNYGYQSRENRVTVEKISNDDNLNKLEDRASSRYSYSYRHKEIAKPLHFMTIDLEVDTGNSKLLLKV